MFRRVAVGLVASAATLLAGVPAHATAPPPARSPQPSVTSVRPAHRLPSHRHREAVRHTPATAGTHSKRDGGSAATAAPVTSAAPAVPPSSQPSAASAAGAHVLDSLAARAPPARQ